MGNRLFSALSALIIILAAAGTAVAQNYQIQHQSPTVVERGLSVNLEFRVPGLNINDIQDAFLYYRYDGESSFQQQNARFTQGMFTVPFTVENQDAATLEYYFAAILNNGDRITYPTDYSTSEEPVRVDVVEPDVTEKTDRVEGIEYTILSPEPQQSVASNDVLVAITLFYEEGTVDTTTSSFRLTVDGEDVTEQADANEYFFAYAPDNIQPGNHEATLTLVRPDEELVIASWGFTVSEAQFTVGTTSGTSGRNTLIPTGRVELSARNQVIGGNTNDALRGNVRMSGAKGNVRYTAYGLLTSQESSRLQPQNRYGAELYVGNWLELQGGHIYPTISSMTIAGRRVQGVNANVHAFRDAVNLQFMYGQIRRDISNLYGHIQSSIQTFNGAPIDTNYTLSFQDGGTGTFQREVLGARLAFGRDRTFQWGLNFLKVQDDTASVNLIRDYNDVLNIAPSLDDSLSAAARSDLSSNPDELSVDGNPVPKGNFVASTDLNFNLFQNKIRFNSEAAASLLNDDISGGPLTSENDLGIEIDQDTENLLERLSWLIIINENMSTIPFRFDVQGNNTEVTPFFPTGILATESELTANYFNNNLRLRYRWIGPAYTSLANSTIRKDIAGLSVTDRFRLFQNRLYVTLGYEDLNDNLTGIKDATTDTRTYRTNLSWYPISRDLPRVSVGFKYRNRDNGVSLNNPFIDDPAKELASIRNFQVLNGDTLLTANPRFNNTTQLNMSVSQQFTLFDITHDASLNYSILKSRDDQFAYGDTDNNTISANVTSRLQSIPLNTTVGLSYNTTETLSGLSSTDIFGFNLGGSYFLLDDKLNVRANFAFTKNSIESAGLSVNDNGTPNDTNDDYLQPTTDASGNRVINKIETNLFMFRAGAQYTLNPNHAFVLDMNFTNVSSKLGNASLNNDRVIQFRYIYSF